MQRETARQGTENITAQLEQEFNQNKDKVVQMLIENCITVDTSIPRVVRGRFDEDK